MSNYLTILKKELKRFFTDRRMVLSCLVFPALIIYVMYSFLGEGLGKMFGTDESYIPTVYVINQPDSYAMLLTSARYVVDTKTAEENQLTELQHMVSDKEADLIIVYPQDFDAAVAAYDPTSGLPAPNIRMYYNSTETNSSNAYSAFNSLYTAYETTMTNKLDINRPTSLEESFDLASERDVTGMLFSTMGPLLILILMFSGCMSLAPESIAGEKERGTIATLLVTPMKRSHLAIGKITALAIEAVCCALSSFLALLVTMPKLMSGQDISGIDANIYGFGEYAALLAIIVTLVLLFISAMSVLSAFASSVKEATSLIMPLYMVVMFVGISTMFTSVGTKTALYLIPIFGSAQALVSVFNFSYSATGILLTLASNIVCTAGLVFLLARMFNSEKIMFSK